MRCYSLNFTNHSELLRTYLIIVQVHISHYDVFKFLSLVEVIRLSIL